MPLDRRSGIAHGYLGLAPGRPDAPVGRRLSDRLYRSCTSVEALCGPSWRDFEACQQECRDAAWCQRWRSCLRRRLRDRVIERARNAVHLNRLRALWRMIAR